MPLDDRRDYDVLVVGAGPAGLAAATSASGEGRRVGLVDDNPDLGGQIWRGERARPTSPIASLFFKMFDDGKIEHRAGTRVVGLVEPGVLWAESGRRPVELAYRSLILATGARELFLPFPGWTLPNVMGAGGLQAMVKSGLPIAGKSVVVAGSGPLLLAVAASLKKKGAIVRSIAEQAPIGKLVRFGLGLWSEPDKLQQAIGLRLGLGGVPFRAGWWPVEARGDDRVREVSLTDGRKTRTESCDYLACGFGLVPNLELPGLLGCEIGPGGTTVDRWQQTTVPGVYCAGEAAGIGGLDSAWLEGRIAGLAAVGKTEGASYFFRDRDKARRFARSLERAFAPRNELRDLARPDTIVCRCEDVTAGALVGRTSWVDAKLQTRCGMGPCQGRICGGAVAFLHGWSRGSVRPPIFPTLVANLGDAETPR
ncbi:NAD(P)/FAD-dependent oxidoreductase [Tundrisphaera lichenicola]|uniref:FAD/NAD(P)-dependent oxidoreductase n=1 Tax=Tundrisphaera lichenicola TaxID=2029860 RepID=UPI003EB8D008